MSFSTWRKIKFADLPRDVQFLERTLGQMNFNFWVIEAILARIERIHIKGELLPASINVFLQPNQIPKNRFLVEQYEHWLTREATLALLFAQWQEPASLNFLNPPHIIPVRLRLADYSLPARDLNIFNILPFLIKVSLRLMSYKASPHRKPGIEINSLNWYPNEVNARLQLGSTGDMKENSSCKIDSDPFWIGNAKNFPRGFSFQSKLWNPDKKGTYLFLDDYHARLDWDGKRHWIWNTGAQEVWLGGINGSWKRVHHNKPYSLQPGQSIVLGRLFKSEREPVVLPGSVRLQYLCEG